MSQEIDFTRTALINAKHIDGKDTEYKFKGKPHLRATVRTSQTTLSIKKQVNGIRLNKKIGTFPQMSLSTFEKIANEYIEQAQTGSHFHLAHKATLDQFFHQVYLPHAKKNKRSARNDESRFRLYIRDKLGKLKLSQIKPVHILNLLNNLPEHLSDRSHDLIRALLSAIFSMAIKLELLDRNPCRAVPTKNSCNVVTRVMTEQETQAFVCACLEEADVTSEKFSFHSLCLLLSLLTGMRIGNSCAITRSMISQDGQSLLIPRTKSGKSQLFYLSPPAQWVIEQCLKVSNSEYLFPSPKSSNIPIGHPRSTFIRICKRAGIACSGSNHPLKDGFPSENLTIHCLRKTFGTVVLNNHTSTNGSNASSMDLVRRLLGHASETVTRTHYAFSQDKDLIDGVNLAGTLLTQGIRNLPTTPKTEQF